MRQGFKLNWLYWAFSSEQQLSSSSKCINFPRGEESGSRVVGVGGVYKC